MFKTDLAGSGAEDGEVFAGPHTHDVIVQSRAKVTQAIVVTKHLRHTRSMEHTLSSIRH